jgi:hypothetical protein
MVAGAFVKTFAKTIGGKFGLRLRLGVPSRSRRNRLM